MPYSIKHIASIIGAHSNIPGDKIITHLLTDSRKVLFPASSLFFAIGGPRRNGEQFIPELYERGVRAFVVSSHIDNSQFSEACFLQVNDVVKALQQLAAHHRQQFHYPVIGITGSNGKTIVKEWLYQLLQKDYQIVRSPRSYNSQIGVPLSVWQMQRTNDLGIFEAGISTRGEMQALANIIQPEIGVFTNIADAHREGFGSDREKALEKARLFEKAKQLVFCREALAPALLPDTSDKSLFPANMRFFSWSRESQSDLQIKAEVQQAQQTKLTASYQHQTIHLTVPFTDRISLNNAITCWAVLLAMGYDQPTIAERMALLEPVDMRMQLKKGINHTFILNDSYSNDIASLDLAIDYLKQQAGSQKSTIILSDLLQSGQTPASLYRQIALQLCQRGVNRLIGIGTDISTASDVIRDTVHASGHPMQLSFYDATASFLQQAGTDQFRDEYILLKGARVFAFERIGQWLEQKVHQTVMEINLTAMIHNLKVYQQALLPATKVMAMVKAFSYGSGSAEVARVLAFHKIDYLAVAYADEGVALRQAGINLPIMVMNIDEAGFESMVAYDLEPEIYSFPIYEAFHQYLMKQAIQQFPIHIKFNTGMNRLGFEVTDTNALILQLQQNNTMMVRSVLSHLVGSENPLLDDFTAEQVAKFTKACTEMEQGLGYAFIRHIANSAGIFRYPHHQFDMVRLGIGLYGVDSAGSHQPALETVATLKTTIAQVRKIAAGETVGYNRKGVVKRESIIATVRIGYADGYHRSLGNGVGTMYVRGKAALVIGNVCMDMTMLDVTDIPDVKEGDSVEVFGKQVTVQELAAKSGTIAYEIMTGISQRVKRIYLEE